MTIQKELAKAIKETSALATRIDADVERQRLQALVNGVASTEEFYLTGHDSTGRHTRPSASSPLYAHQKDGVRWLLALYRLGVRGAILADEMGLGKTIQIIAFFSALAKEGSLGTYLIVAPLSTLENWQRELTRWVPWMHVEVLRGDHAARTKLRHRIRTRHRRAFQKRETLRQSWLQGMSPAALAKDLGGVVLTSYEMLLTDHGALARLLHWDVTVVDEAQRLKKFDCRLLRMLEKATCGLRLILTGTPVQNNVDELWTLLEYVAPDRFANAEYRAAITAEAKQSSAGDGPHSHGAAALAQSLQQALQSFMLRRTKQSVGIELPPKLDLLLPTPMTTSQRAFYERVLSTDKFGSGRLTHLRKCCIHPFLFPQFEAEAAATPSGDQCVHSVNGTFTPEEEALAIFLSYSGKMQLLDRLLSGLRGQGTAMSARDDAEAKSVCAPHRVLLFSQMTKALDVVEHYLHLKERAMASRRSCHTVDGALTEATTAAPTPHFPYVRLDGASSAEERFTSIAAFQLHEPPTKSSATDTSSAAGDREPTVHSRRRTPFLGQYVEEGVVEDDCVFDTTPPRSTPIPPPSSHWSSAALPVPQQKHPARRPFAVRDTNQLHAGGQQAVKTKKTYSLLGCSSALPTAAQRAAPPSASMESNHEDSTTSVPSSDAPAARAQDAVPFLFLISTKTGGAGLNLTAADTVIMLDGDYNPQNDQQAVDRCHRIGQTRPVMVYRLITPDSAEEQQLAFVTTKLALESALLNPSAGELAGPHKRPRREPTNAERPLMADTPDLGKPMVVFNNAVTSPLCSSESAIHGHALTVVPLMNGASHSAAAQVLAVEKQALSEAVLQRVLDRESALCDVRTAVKSGL